MTMRAGSAACCTEIADRLSLRYGRPLRYGKSGHMRIQCLIAVTMVNDDIVAVAVGISCRNDSSSICSTDGAAFISVTVDIDTAV